MVAAAEVLPFRASAAAWRTSSRVSPSRKMSSTPKSARCRKNRASLRLSSESPTGWTDHARNPIEDHLCNFILG